MSGNRKRNQGKHRIRMAVWMLLAAGCILPAAGCGRMPQADPETPGGREARSAQGPETDEHTDRNQPVILQNLHSDGSLLSRTFYQAGNINNRLYCYVRPGEDGDAFALDELGLAVVRMTPHFDEIAYNVSLAVNADTLVETVPGQNTYRVDFSVQGYQNGEVVLEQVCPVTITLPSGAVWSA